MRATKTWRSLVAVTVLAAVASACLPNYPDPPAVPTRVVGSSPAPGGLMIPAATPIALAFSGAVAPASMTISLSPAAALGSAQWLLGNKAVAFTPPAPLTAATTFTLTVSGNDAAGHALSTTPITFTTAPATAVLSATHPRLLLKGTTRTRLVNALTTGSPAATRFKAAIDNHLVNNNLYDYEPWWGALLGQLTGTASYCTDSVARIDQWVAAAEADIAANVNPEVAGDSYLHVGDGIGGLALVWDWCPTFRTAGMTARWSAFAQQTLFNVWHPDTATWGSRSAPWSGWGTDNPRNNYFLSFVHATLLWGAAANGEHPAAAGWLAQAQVKIGHDLPIIHTTETPGGGLLEGTGYGTAIKRLLFLQHIWEASTGQRWADVSSSSEAWIRYELASIVPGNDFFAPIGDQARISDAPFTDYQREILLALAELHRGRPWGRLARNRAGVFLPQMERLESSVFDFLYGTADAGTAAVMPLTYHAPGTGHVFTRSSG